ncbi:MAG: peptide chain release factor N(5)-glutamine methyltransferase [Desulfovibrio sp.]|nr:peptide chain release factor N(5)-glutamine methyltransferase [Desulfovibrio sp.]
MRVREFEELATHRLQKAQRDSPRRSAQLLLCHVLHCDRLGLFLQDKRNLLPKEEKALFHLLAKREKGMPIAYLLGEKEFFGRRFLVSEKTLIPRPETEHLIEAVLERFPEKASALFVDLGCGTGNIGLTLALERPYFSGILLDKSREALNVCQNNRQRFSLNDRILLFQGTFEALPFAKESLDLIVANPPYIGFEEKNRIMDEVLLFEPHCALFAEDNGLADLETILNGAEFALKKGGFLILEHGDRQGKILRKRLANAFSDIITLCDLASRERITLGKR